MGIGPDSVVTPSLQLHGLDNLRVCDASIMPKIISGNLQATAILSAERYASFWIPVEMSEFYIVEKRFHNSTFSDLY